ncbi:MAG: cysteine synthase A [Pseudomonadota bacterium]
MNIANNMTDLVGRTPLVRLNRVNQVDGVSNAEILVKLEFFNPCSSVKDRVGLNMIEAAMARGDVREGATLVEPTSGNTGVGLAFVSAVRGLKLILTLPENMSQERIALLRGFGAKLVLTPASEGMTGAVKAAERIVAETEGAVMLQQFANPDNPATHELTTGPEIWQDTDGTVDIFVAGVGTGGTLSGISHYLKKQNPDIQIVAVEPAESAVLSGNKGAPHGIQGIGAGFIPDALDTNAYDKIIQIKSLDAIAMGKRLLQEEGILCGISSGANVCAALELAQMPENAGKRIVTIICDTGERYLSTALFAQD